MKFNFLLFTLVFSLTVTSCREDEPPVDYYSGHYLVEYSSRNEFSSATTYFELDDDRIVHISRIEDTLYLENKKYVIEWFGQSDFVEMVPDGQASSLLSFTDNYNSINYQQYTPSLQSNKPDTTVTFSGSRTDLYNSEQHPKRDQLIGNYLFDVYHYKYVDGIDDSWTAGGFLDIQRPYPASNDNYKIFMFGEEFLVEPFISHLHDKEYYPSSSTEENLYWASDSIHYDYLQRNPFPPDSILEIWIVDGHRVY